MKVARVKVFVDENGNHGDLVPVIVDERRRISDSERIEIASNQNGVETAFINDIKSHAISIVHSQGEIDFAGTVALGVSWFFSETNGKPITSMQGRDGEIITWQEDGIVWVSADSSTLPSWNIEELDSVEAVENMKISETDNIEHAMFWAWIDESKGSVRARTFAADWDISEAEANGSGAMMLAQKLNKDIKIKHGAGSVIFARARSDKKASLGGRVIKSSETSVKNS